MPYDDERLSCIFDKTDGRCHLCGAGLAFGAYGDSQRRGAWEVEHSVPRALGGTDHLNNLYPACIPCNRGKGADSTRSTRAINGLSRAPMSLAEQTATRRGNAVGWGLLGGIVAALLADWHNQHAVPEQRIDPFEAFLAGGTVGGIAGYNADPEA